MNALALTSANADAYPVFVQPGARAIVKVCPRIDPGRDAYYRVTLPCGTICHVVRGKEDRWCVDIDPAAEGSIRRGYSSLKNAIESCARFSRLRFEPIVLPSLGGTFVATAQRAESADVVEAGKILRKILQHRTGRAWSVTHGRGTVTCWLKIMSPPARRTELGAMTMEDQILLHAAIGGSPEHQGVSVGPEGGVRGSYVFRCAGVPIPSDWKITKR